MNLDNIWPLIWVTAIAGMGGTGLGGVVACLFRKESDKAVSLLLSFAAGVMTAVVCFDLLTEALNTGDRVHLWLVASGVLFGYTIISVSPALSREALQLALLRGWLLCRSICSSRR